MRFIIPPLNIWSLYQEGTTGLFEIEEEGLQVPLPVFSSIMSWNIAGAINRV